uniref:Glyoxalase/bleomycin resistance protein/dioxygenase n=1 Tax=Salinispora arenicola (strain CNS-205) TaxID=391037 RepID=A8M564_SALAI
MNAVPPPTTCADRTFLASPHRIGITIDCPDPASAAAFWERFLGYQRRPHAEGSTYVTVDCPEHVAGPPHLTFQQVPEPKTSKARAHLDLFVDHARPLTQQMLAAGAQQVSVTEAGEWTTRVLTDPAGNEFCVIGPD